VGGKNVSSLSEAEFDRVHELLCRNDIEIACFGSTVANWGRDAGRDFEQDMIDMKNSIRHMTRAGVRFIRIMSYRVEEPLPLGSSLEAVIIDNIRQIVELAEDHGLVCLHENCETWGGQSYLHALRLLEQIDSPALKLVFDTGNPVAMHDVRGQEPYGYQDPLYFFDQVREHVAYLHVKDGRMVDGTMHYCFPGEGDGHVVEILRRLAEHQMSIPISIEPHVAVVFHDPSIKAPFDERWNNFIDYGNQLVTMAEDAGIRFSLS
jgi:sugar phosphate isomerase/epimerase